MARTCKSFLIYNSDQADVLTDRRGMYWNNRQGWVATRREASKFSPREKAKISALPGRRSKWVCASKTRR